MMTLKEKIYERLLEISVANDEYRANGNISTEARALEMPEPQFIKTLNLLKDEGKIAAFYREGNGDFSLIVHKSEYIQ